MDLEKILNSLVADEYFAFTEYIFLSVAARGAGLHSLSKKLNDVAKDELTDHYVKLTNWMQANNVKIYFNLDELKNVANCPMDEISDGITTEKAVALFLNAEMKAIDAYKMYAKQIQVDYPELYQLFLEITNDELEHKKDAYDLMSEINSDTESEFIEEKVVSQFCKDVDNFSTKYLANFSKMYVNNSEISNLESKVENLVNNIDKLVKEADLGLNSEINVDVDLKSDPFDKSTISDIHINSNNRINEDDTDKLVEEINNFALSLDVPDVPENDIEVDDNPQPESIEELKFDEVTENLDDEPKSETDGSSEYLVDEINDEEQDDMNDIESMTDEIANLSKIEDEFDTPESFIVASKLNKFSDDKIQKYIEELSDEEYGSFIQSLENSAELFPISSSDEKVLKDQASYILKLMKARNFTRNNKKNFAEINKDEIKSYAMTLATEIYGDKTDESIVDKIVDHAIDLSKNDQSKAMGIVKNSYCKNFSFVMDHEEGVSDENTRLPELRKELIPEYGPSNKVEGEALRAIDRIYYEFFKNNKLLSDPGCDFLGAANIFNSEEFVKLLTPTFNKLLYELMIELNYDKYKLIIDQLYNEMIEYLLGLHDFADNKNKLDYTEF